MKKINIIVTSAALVLTLFASTTQAGYVEPGSEADPLVSKSYVEQKFNEIKKSSDLNRDKLEKIEKDIEKIVENNQNNSNNQNNQSSAEVFKVVELKKGQTLIAEESTEIIVRSGNADAIASENGGISDITNGKDLNTGDEVELNHLLIIPRTDGRGLEIKSGVAFVMIKGRYSVK